MVKYESPIISESTKPTDLENLRQCQECKIMFRIQYDDTTTNLIERTAAILTMTLSLYLSRTSYNFYEIWSAGANFSSKNGHETKYQNFAIRILKVLFWLHLCYLLPTRFPLINVDLLINGCGKTTTSAGGCRRPCQFLSASL